MNYVTRDTELKAVADAIRGKTGGQDELTYPDEFVSEICTLHSNDEVDTLHGAIKTKILPSTPNLWDSTNNRAPVESGKHYKAVLTYTPAADDKSVEFVVYYADGEGNKLGADMHLIETFAAGTYDGSTAADFTFQVPDISGAQAGTQYYLMVSEGYGVPEAVNIQENGPRTAEEWLAAVDDLYDTSDADAVATDIKTGKTAYVNGVKLTGSFNGVDTSDANAAAAEIKNGKTAYVNGTKITGSYKPGRTYVERISYQVSTPDDDTGTIYNNTTSTVTKTFAGGVTTKFATASLHPGLVTDIRIPSASAENEEIKIMRQKSTNHGNSYTMNANYTLQGKISFGEWTLNPSTGRYSADVYITPTETFELTLQGISGSGGATRYRAVIYLYFDKFE